MDYNISISPSASLTPLASTVLLQQTNPITSQIPSILTAAILSPPVFQVEEPIIYSKGERKTKDVVPTNKNLIGKGFSGKVYAHRNNSLRVIKKSSNDLESEYKLGAKLNHPNLCKSHRLYIKKYGYGYGNTYKLEMDKINGSTLNCSSRSISDETVKKMLAQIQNCCLYLFIQKVVWRDVHDENIFITKDNNDLIFIDFGYWKEIEDPRMRAALLILESIEIVSSIMENSEQISFPKNFFGGHEMPEITDSLDSLSRFDYNSNEKWMQDFKAKLATMTEEVEMKDFIKEYFTQVEIAFNNT